MPTSITLLWNSAFSICTKCSEFLKLQSFRLHCQSRGACFAALKQCALSVHTWSGTFLLPPCPSQLWPCPQLEDAASPAIAIACARFAGTAGILGRCRTSPHSPSRVLALHTHTLSSLSFNNVGVLGGQGGMWWEVTEVLSFSIKGKIQSDLKQHLKFIILLCTPVWSRWE